jgi:hypothetical protein
MSVPNMPLSALGQLKGGRSQAHGQRVGEFNGPIRTTAEKDMFGTYMHLISLIVHV